MRKTSFILAAVAAFLGCGGVRDDSARDLDASFRSSENQVKESRTLASLGKLEASLADHTKHEKKIPARLEDLIPKYLAEMPAVELGLREHRDSSAAKNYPTSVLRGGQVDGTRIGDTGKWGYVFTEDRVVVFVDCTHLSRRGKPWYQERGVY